MASESGQECKIGEREGGEAENLEALKILSEGLSLFPFGGESCFRVEGGVLGEANCSNPLTVPSPAAM